MKASPDPVVSTSSELGIVSAEPIKNLPEICFIDPSLMLED
jgi:hypothetical protein